MELFRMLKEVGKGVEKVFENSGAMDRKSLIESLEKHLHRHKTISILEGREKRKAET
jgi:cytokinesis protein